MKEQDKALAIAGVKQHAESDHLEFWHDHLREGFATVPVKTHRENWRIRSRDFRLWVQQTLFDLIGCAPKGLVSDCLHEFETLAVCRGEQHTIHVRVAGGDDSIHVDLSNSDWSAVNVNSTEWHIVGVPAVKFLRHMAMAPLPNPIRQDKSLCELLRPFLNLHPHSEQLALSWLSYSLRPGLPYPILALSGVQGSGKSTITRVLRSLSDPNVAALTTTPRSERDLAIAATSQHLIAMDNVTAISEKLSDALCRMATGGSFRTRKLYSDTDETILTYKRPLIINGIPELPQRPDLLDRSILIRLAPISEDKRLDEQQFWREFEATRPAIFGALLSTLCAGLDRIDKIDLPDVPRMADFAKWGVAIEEHLGFGAGSFIEAYRKNLEHGVDLVLEASPIAVVLERFIVPRKKGWAGGRHEFRGTALELLRELNDFEIGRSNKYRSDLTISDVARKNPAWPKSAQQLSADIGRIEPVLERRGIEVQRGRNHQGRFLVLRRRDEGTDSTVTPETDKDKDFVAA